MPNEPSAEAAKARQDALEVRPPTRDPEIGLLARLYRPMTERRMFGWVAVLAVLAVVISAPQFCVAPHTPSHERWRTGLNVYLAICAGTLAMLLQARRHFVAHALDISRALHAVASRIYPLTADHRAKPRTEWALVAVPLGTDFFLHCTRMFQLGLSPGEDQPGIAGELHAWARAEPGARLAAGRHLTSRLLGFALAFDTRWLLERQGPPPALEAPGVPPVAEPPSVARPGP